MLVHEPVIKHLTNLNDPLRQDFEILWAALKDMTVQNSNNTDGGLDKTVLFMNVVSAVEKISGRWNPDDLRNTRPAVYICVCVVKTYLRLSIIQAEKAAYWSYFNLNTCILNDLEQNNPELVKDYQASMKACHIRYIQRLLNN